MKKDQFVLKLQSHKCSWIFNRYEIRRRQEKYFMDKKFLNDIMEGYAEEWDVKEEW